MKLKNYLTSENYSAELEKIAESFDIEISEGLGDGVKRAITKKKQEIIDSMNYIKSLAMKTVKITKDKDKIKQLEIEIKQAEKELEDVIVFVSNSLDFMFDGQ